MSGKNTAHVSEPGLVPCLSLAYLVAVKKGRGDVELMAFALSPANWAVAAVADPAQCTGRTGEQVVDQTAILAVADESGTGA